MAINSVSFLLAFVVILIIYYLIPSNRRIYFLLPVSLAFYALVDYRYLLMLLGVIILSFYGAKLLCLRTLNLRLRKSIFIFLISLFSISLLLMRFLPANTIIIPLGYSFYVLQAIGYLSDVYKETVEAESDFFIYALFISYFPTITSGPIQRSTGLLKLFHKEVEFDYSTVRRGLLMIAYGLFIKNFVADRLGNFVNRGFDGLDEVSGFTLFLVVIVYAFQLYCDFMGYSLIAIGMSLSLGFKLEDNFKRPYFSTSIKEFWGRWHISLSTWLKDYIYIPLGGSKKGFIRKLINILIVFIASGIWHGRGATFLVWGLLHGIYRVIESLFEKKQSASASRKQNPFLKIISCIWTFILVDFAWLFFRANSLPQAFSIIKMIIFENRFVETLKTGAFTFGISKKELLVWFLGLLIVFVVDYLSEKGHSIVEWFEKRSIAFRWAVYALWCIIMIYSTVYYYGYSASQFIYAGF